MRDALLLLVVLATLILAMRYPFAGLIVWAWFSLMTPHQMAYGVYGIPLNLLIAAATITAILVNGAYKNFKLETTTLLLVLFAGWLFISQLFSLDPEYSAPYFDRFIKLILFVILCAQMTDSKLRLHALLWILVISLGYFAAKGALFTIVTLGQYRVQGIEHTILEDNNHMGIALATVLPLILYMRGQAAQKWVRRGLLALFALTIFSILGTHSRGAFVSLVVFAGYFWLQSNRKISMMAALFFLMVPAIAFMPSKWTERMSTITEATQDQSFMGRVDAWIINWKFALQNPVTGAGLRNPYQEDLAAKVDLQRAKNAKAAHSIFFEVLGGTGFVGLALYLGIFATAFFTARRYAFPKTSEGKSDTARAPPWKASFGYNAQIALVVFAAGGASTSMEMWDGYMIVIAMIAALGKIANEPSSAMGKPYQPVKKYRWRISARGRSV